VETPQFVVARGAYSLMSHSFKQLAQDEELADVVAITGTAAGCDYRQACDQFSADARIVGFRIHPLPQTSLQANKLRYH
jgi:hypothetical protein